jgi:long-chain acyl-CoA synthetase
MVVGDAQPYIACLVTLDDEALPCLADDHGKPAMSLAEAARTPMSSPRSSRRSTTPTRPSQGRGDQTLQDPGRRLDGESGAFTPSLKLKRNVVMKEYAGDVDALYS